MPDISTTAFLLTVMKLASRPCASKIAPFNAMISRTLSDIIIPVYDVYYSFINNGLIDTTHFESGDATATEKAVLNAYNDKEASVLAELNNQLKQANGTVYNQLPKEYQE